MWSITNGLMRFGSIPLVTASIPAKTYIQAMTFSRNPIMRGFGDLSTSCPTARHEDDGRNPVPPTIQTRVGPRIARG
jgi:hypothetical protein